jgi:RNA polymerase sigma-70 factor, ECF subfamily
MRLRSLLIAGVHGNAAAYRAFLEQLTAHLRAFLRKRLFCSHPDVEDLVQEVLLAVHNARHTYLPEQPLTAWVHAIARYKLADYLRARHRRERLNDPLGELTEELLTEAEVEPASASRDVEELLKQLPDKQRLPILHVKIEGLSVAETARLTGFSESAVKVGIHRGLKALAARMKASSENG